MKSMGVYSQTTVDSVTDRCRRGFTKVEFVAVTICILILLSLLIPALPDGHTPRRRNQCSTNMKNHALAAIQYEMAKGHFPGYIEDFGTYVPSKLAFDPSDPDADVSTLVAHRKIGTWAVAVLPWLDAQPTYEHWTVDQYPIVMGGSKKHPLSTGISGDGYSAFAAPNLAIFQCPEDERRGITHGRNSYVCNAGMYSRSASGPSSWPSPQVDFASSMRVANGVFNNQFAGLDDAGTPVATGPRVKLDDFADGQGYTMLITENLQAIPWHRAGLIDANDLVVSADGAEIQYPESSRFTQGVVWHYEHHSGAGGAPAVDPIHRINGRPPGTTLDRLVMIMTPQNCYDVARPSSLHVDGVNMAFADGATRFVSESIDYHVYQALLTPDGANSDVPDPSFIITNELGQ